MRRASVFIAFTLFLAFAAYSRAQAQSIPDQAYISGVVGHAQAYSLSCEARSAADWAAYWGIYIDETEFLNSLPHSDNPNEGFVGDPNDPWGYRPPYSYGVHADPVADLLRAYGLDAHADTDVSWNEVRGEVAAGRPVIVWVIGSIWSGEASEYETEDGQLVTVANNEHTMIVIGYDKDQVHLVDALTGYTVTHPLENFLNSWGVLGNMAIVGEGSGSKPADQVDQEQGNGATYTVQPGDTLNKVAARFNLYWPDLAAWNDIAYPYIIYPGQSLLVGDVVSEAPTDEPDTDEPSPDEDPSYLLPAGGNLLSAAAEAGIDWTALARFNEVQPPFLLAANSILHLPPDDYEPDALETPETYTAAQTESLVALAEYYGLDWISLAGKNNLSFPYLLTPGQSIVLQ